MKKIVFLTDQISHIGGITSLIHIKSNYWVNTSKYNVDIITTEQKKQPSYYPLDKKINLHDLSINYNRYSSYFSPRNFLRILENLFLLQKKINRIKPDFIIVANHIPVTFFFPLLITKAKIIKEFHFSKYHISKRKKTLFKRFENFLEQKFDHLIVLNPEERTFYKHDNVITIPNPIVFESTKEPIFKNREKIAIAAGRISEVKRFNLLIDIWSDFIKLKKDWTLEIYGDGEKSDISLLKNKIADLKLNKYIKLKGSTNKIKNVMNNSGLYLMTSIAECFPMVLLEAQSCGLPIIAFDCPTGPRNIITNDNGVLVKMDDKDLFVKKLLALTSDEEKRISIAKNGYLNCKKYQLEDIMDIWDKNIIKK